MPRQADALLAAFHCYWRSLRGRRFDIVISPRWDRDFYLATFLCALTRAPLTVGYEDGTSAAKARWNAGFQRTWSILLPAGPLQHEVKRNLAVGGAVGCDDSDQRPELKITARERTEARAWLGSDQDGFLLAVGLSASHPRRRWIADRYLAMLHLLGQRCSVRPVLFADLATNGLAQGIMNDFPQSRVAMLLPLPQVAALLSQCTAFIGSDSALGHIAAAVACPTVTLSPNSLTSDPANHQSPLRIRPYGARSLVLQPKRPRAGCEAGCEGDRPHCILDISPQDAADAILNLR